MLVANRIGYRAVRPPGRMNSRLQLHEVRLRGLGGPAVEGVPRHLRVRNRGLPDQIRNRHHSLRAGLRRHGTELGRCSG